MLSQGDSTARLAALQHSEASLVSLAARLESLELLLLHPLEIQPSASPTVGVARQDLQHQRSLVFLLGLADLTALAAREVMQHQARRTDEMAATAMGRMTSRTSAAASAMMAERQHHQAQHSQLRNLLVVPLSQRRSQLAAAAAAPLRATALQLTSRQGILVTPLAIQQAVLVDEASWRTPQAAAQGQSL
jgi:hypothetical protein